jgi:DNA-binding CsgD family transcriptional regulator
MTMMEATWERLDNDGAARTLDVSIKTIEKHLGDIYRGLGINSRAALAAEWSA